MHVTHLNYVSFSSKQFMHLQQQRQETFEIVWLQVKHYIAVFSVNFSEYCFQKIVQIIKSNF